MGEKPREIRNAVIVRQGGINNLHCTAGIPSLKRIYCQISNEKLSGIDDFHGLILRCIEEANATKVIVRHVEVAPSSRVMLANERQLNDRVRFGNSGGFSLDTNLNIGSYLVSIVIVRNMLL